MSNMLLPRAAYQNRAQAPIALDKKSLKQFFLVAFTPEIMHHER